MTQEKIPPVIQNPVNEDEIDLSEMIGMLIENRLLIVSTIFLFFVLALFYSLFSRPVYKVDAIVQIEQQSSSMQGMDELDALLGSDSSSSVTEIEIIKSRKVIGGMVDKLNLTTQVEFNYFPLIGSYLVRKHGDTDSLADSWMGFSSYAWGGERINVDRFEVSGNKSEPFTLIAKDEGQYVVLDSNGHEVLQGEVGLSAESKHGDVRIFVSRLIAHQDMQFTLIKSGHNSVVADYQKKIKISEKGKKTGILSISLEGTDRAKIKSIIDVLTQGYLRQNVEQKSAESENMLRFINAQLPVLKSSLNAAEIALNHHRERKGTIDLSYESQNLIERITRIEASLSDLELERSELIQKLTPDHPVIQGLHEKTLNLKQQKHELDKKMLALPETELESVKFSRDVTVANELYMLLLNKSQELKVSKAGTIGSARIIDHAVVIDKPIKPKKALIVVISLLLGFIVGVLISVLRKVLNHTIDDPNIIEKQLGYTVYAEIPFSDFQAGMIKKAKKNNKASYQVLSHVHSDVHGDDVVVESLRSLRTSIQFALMEARNKVVTITGPSPEIGKSFISVNFAYLMAESGKKVLLLDADLRKGHINNYFDIERSPGLSEAISGGEWQSAVHKSLLNENLDVLTSGIYPPNPSELLMSQCFSELLTKANEIYDLIIIDTPPVLAVTDAAIICQHSASNFMVVRSQHHHLRELQTAFKRFEQNGVHINGAIFNGIELTKGRYGYKYYGYQYSYK